MCLFHKWKELYIIWFCFMNKIQFISFFLLVFSFLFSEVTHDHQSPRTCERFLFFESIYMWIWTKHISIKTFSDYGTISNKFLTKVQSLRNALGSTFPDFLTLEARLCYIHSLFCALLTAMWKYATAMGGDSHEQCAMSFEGVFNSSHVWGQS